jgi:hypothetical protein
LGCGVSGSVLGVDPHERWILIFAELHITPQFSKEIV